MKINSIMAIIALGISALGTFGFYSANAGDKYQLLITVCAGIMIFVPMLFLLAISARNGAGANVKVVSAIFFIINIISNILFSIGNFQKPSVYIIVNGILFLIYIALMYLIIKALN